MLFYFLMCVLCVCVFVCWTCVSFRKVKNGTWRHVYCRDTARRSRLKRLTWSISSCLNIPPRRDEQRAQSARSMCTGYLFVWVRHVNVAKWKSCGKAAPLTGSLLCHMKMLNFSSLKNPLNWADSESRVSRCLTERCLTIAIYCTVYTVVL